MKFIKLFENYNNDISIIETDSTVSSFIIMNNRRSVVDASELYDKNWEINRAFIQPEHRRSGIGSKLLQMTIAEILKKNPKSIIVTPGGYGSDLDDLFKFYGKNGFIMDDSSNFMYYPV